MTRNTIQIDALALIPRVIFQASALAMVWIAWTHRTDKGMAFLALGIGAAFMVAWGILFWIDRIYLNQEGERWARVFGTVLFVSIWGLVTVINWWGAVSIYTDWPTLVLFGGAALVGFWPSMYFGRSMNLPVASSNQQNESANREGET